MSPLPDPRIDHPLMRTIQLPVIPRLKGHQLWSLVLRRPAFWFGLSVFLAGFFLVPALALGGVLVFLPVLVSMLVISSTFAGSGNQWIARRSMERYTEFVQPVVESFKAQRYPVVECSWDLRRQLYHFAILAGELKTWLTKPFDEVALVPGETAELWFSDIKCDNPGTYFIMSRQADGKAQTFPVRVWPGDKIKVQLPFKSPL